MGNTKIIVIASIVSFLIGGGVFFGIAWCTSNFNYISDEEAAQLSTMRWLMQDKLQDYNIQDDMNHVSGENIRGYLRNLTQFPHLAGQDRDRDLAHFIRDKFSEFGLDAKLNKYKLRLSYPNQTNPNKITLSNDEDGIFFTSNHSEVYPGGSQLPDNFVDGFLAYSPRGQVGGEVVYCNYADVNDFDLLNDVDSEYFTNTTGKICMARFGKIYR